MAEQESDFQLIRNYKEGDESSLNLLLRKYQQKIYWHARKMAGNHMDADEIVQEVMLTLLKSIGDFKFQSSFSTWLYRIITTRTLNYLKRRRVREIFSGSNGSEEENEKVSLKTRRTSILEELENKEKLDFLDRVLKEIPAKQREIFIMRHFDEMTYEEIADITGKSVGGLKANYYHAFAKVNEIMSKKYEKE
ncbi:MAG: RNA polymerase sigma factor [Ignavibacteriales bacterium]|jgi:RNA polymerase sigma-70 factor (ECF subfamily)|nr:RNA polymerase sigma factor [Ignavibacteriaceae bacterium]NLH61102.1 RNA polymerase sigma factor [Ignavibacteriales bacterium]HOJ17593.1 RNA polymerase sigma factor [Ignavibacteriaceae bacterium]